jgi:group I intron endonuclease
MNGKSIIVIVGTYGVGKTWIADQLDKSRYHVISYDSIQNLDDIIREFASQVDDRIKVLDLPIFVSTYLKILTAKFESVRVILVQPSLEELRSNLEKRGGTLTKNVTKKYVRYQRKFTGLAEFVGSSSQALCYLQDPAQHVSRSFLHQGRVIKRNVVKHKNINNDKNIGIYGIFNKKNGKRYIGQATDFIKRKSDHLTLLRHGKHHSPHLQAAYDKYGEQSFEIRLIENCTIDKLDERELYWIDHHKTTDRQFGYNVRLDPSTNRGLTRTFTPLHLTHMREASPRGPKHYKFGTAVMVDLICRFCKKNFKISKARLQHVPGLFCSKSCASKFRFLEKTARQTLKKNCTLCDVEFRTPVSMDNKFCSRQCYVIFVKNQTKKSLDK